MLICVLALKIFLLLHRWGVAVFSCTAAFKVSLGGIFLRCVCVCVCERERENKKMNNYGFMVFGSKCV